MRFLLDTNILIPLEDSKIVLESSLANFVRLANLHHHDLLFHPASERDIARDTNAERRQQTMQRLSRYQRLENSPACPWNSTTTSENDAVDNEILYALQCNAVHALVTEDRRIHAKARALGLQDRAYYIQTAEDWLKRLHREYLVLLPNISEAYLYELDVNNVFFDTLRVGYQRFNSWYAEKSREGRKAWIYRDENSQLGAICIYASQENQIITNSGVILPGTALKLCTFKVGETVRGRKVGELFLKAAFRYATENRIENIFLTTKTDEQPNLIDLLEDFGFENAGTDQAGDAVFVKHHPTVAPNVAGDAFEYHRRYFPHFKVASDVQKFIVPIVPAYHEILFPDYNHGQLNLFGNLSHVGNAIKLAYLCHAPTQKIRRGDIILFYRSTDLKAITSVGIVEDFHISDNPEEIARIVSRRTVYGFDEIQRMAGRPTKVILFRLALHTSQPISYDWLITNTVVNGIIQSIRQMDDAAFSKILRMIDR